MARISLGDPMDSHPSQLHSQWALIKGRRCLLPRTMTAPPPFIPLRFCNENTPCPVPIFWASWGSWNKCSSNCGGGVQSRRRACENGNSCPGCSVVRARAGRGRDRVSGPVAEGRAGRARSGREAMKQPGSHPEGVQDLQPRGLPRSAAQHAVDAVAAGERDSGRGATGAAVPLHVPRAPAGPPWPAVRQEEDGDPNLPCGRLGNLRHRRYSPTPSAPATLPTTRPPRPRAMGQGRGWPGAGAEVARNTGFRRSPCH